MIVIMYVSNTNFHIYVEDRRNASVDFSLSPGPPVGLRLLETPGPTICRCSRQPGSENCQQNISSFWPM